MRAAGAEIGNARGEIGLVAKSAPVRSLIAARRSATSGQSPVLQDPLADGDGDLVRLERAIGREKMIAVLRPSCRSTDGVLAVVEQQFAHMGLEQERASLRRR